MNFELVNKTVCLCGKRHSGKSELIKYIVSLYGHQFNKFLLYVHLKPLINSIVSFYHLKIFLMITVMNGLKN